MQATNIQICDYNVFYEFKTFTFKCNYVTNDRFGQNVCYI